MSGFAGWLATTSGPDPSLAQRMVTLLGSALDGEGIRPARNWLGGEAVFVHRQRITAPQDIGDQQPRTTSDSPLVLLFDGYLTNREDLAESLRFPAAANNWPDSAFTMAALARWGEHAPARLLGDFALAAWNRDARTLLLARDGVGQRPLYYHQGLGFFAFATSPRPLLALPDVPRGLNEDRFARFLMDLPCDPESTFHTQIKSLPAGFQATIAGGRVRSQRYWEPDYERRLHLKRDDDYVEAGRELLDRAVKACLRIHGEPVAAITGGLDSSAVAVTALRHLSAGRLETVTAVHSAPTMLGSKDHYTDERPFVEAIARLHPGLSPHFVSGSGLHVWDRRWTEMFLLTGVPWRNVMNLAWLGPARDRARQLGATVLLGGGLGNLTLSWEGAPSFADAVRRGQWGYVAREIGALSSLKGVSTSRQTWRSVIEPLLPAPMMARIDRFRGRNMDELWLRQSAIRPDLARTFGLDREAAAMLALRRGSTADQRRFAFSHRQVALEVIGLGRALHGLELRDPLADRRLLEFCFAVPDEQYLRNGIARSLARRVVADRLPEEVIANQRRGLQGADFLHRMTLQRQEINTGVERLSGSPLAKRMLDLERMQRMLNVWPEDTNGVDPAFLTVLHRGLHCGQFLQWIEGANAGSCLKDN